MDFTFEQAKALLAAFENDPETIITVIEGDETSHSGPGLYAAYEACTDEGSIFLGRG